MRSRASLLLISLICLAGLTRCASNYVLPNHPMLSPETTGHGFGVAGQITSYTAQKAALDIANGQVDNPLSYSAVSNLDYDVAVGIGAKMDVIMNYEQDAIPMVGVKIQLDDSGGKKKKSVRGMRLAVSGSYGISNNQMNGNVNLNYSSSAQDAAVIGGYRFNRALLLYTFFSYTTYHFASTVESGTAAFNGLKPVYTSTQMGTGLGLELDLAAFLFKAEYDYRSVNSSFTPKKSDTIARFSAGFHF